LIGTLFSIEMTSY